MGLADFRLPEVYLAQSQTIAKLNRFNVVGLDLAKSLTRVHLKLESLGVEGSD